MSCQFFVCTIHEGLPRPPLNNRDQNLRKLHQIMCSRSSRARGNCAAVCCGRIRNLLVAGHAPAVCSKLHTAESASAIERQLSTDFAAAAESAAGPCAL